MSLDLIRRLYGVPAKRGARVKMVAYSKWVYGQVTGSDGLLIRIKPDKWPKERFAYSPDQVEWLGETENTDT